MSEEEKGLSGWEGKSNEQKAKEVEAEFGTDLVDVEEVKEEVKMEEKEIKEGEREETQEELNGI